MKSNILDVEVSEHIEISRNKIEVEMKYIRLKP